MFVYLIFAVAIVSVVIIGLVTVGRETFNASHEMRPAIYDMNEAVQFVSDGLDDRTASRLTPDDVRWILQTDADLIEDDESDDAPQNQVVDMDAATQAVMARLTGPLADVIDQTDVEVVLSGRTRYLHAIGAIGTSASPTEIDGAPESE